MSHRRPRGELISHVLRALWDSDRPLTAKEIQARFPDDPPAVTTVFTVLDRLRSNGEVIRDSSPTGEYRFSTSRSESQFIADNMLEQLLKSRDRADVLLGFAGSLDEHDVAVLRRALDIDEPGES